MQIGYIGLGKMGKNMVLRLLEKKHDVVAWNRSPEPRAEVEAAGAITADSIETLVQQLTVPRLVWVMLPAGQVTSDVLHQLATLLSAGDTVIDGSNNFYKEDEKHSKLFQEKNISFIDVGVSGGPAGARSGACLMIGGDEKNFHTFESLFKDIAAPDAYQFFPGHGAGHFVKMVHNGIEYGMMQAIGEGFSVLKKSPFDFNLQNVARIYNQRSVIDSRLVGWLKSGYEKHGTELEDISGSISHSGEGQWTVETAHELGVDVPIIAGSLQFRVDSQHNPSYTGKVVSVLRNEFGGHEVKQPF